MSAFPLAMMLAALVAALVIVPAVLWGRRGERLARQAHLDQVSHRLQRELAGLSVEELKQRIRESRYFVHREEGGALRDTEPVRRFLACLDADDFHGCGGALADFAAAERAIGCTHPLLLADFDIRLIVDELAARALHPFR